jgi:ribosomal protein S8
MSFLGILKNVAKVGVGLLNGVLNGGSSLTTFEQRCKADPDLVYADSVTGEQFRMLSKYVMDHPDDTRLGEAPASAVEDGEVSITLVEDKNGKPRVHAVNHSKSPYLMSFNTTNALGAIRIKPAIVPSTLSTKGNVVDITEQFSSNTGGNVTATRMENNDNQPTPGTLMLPALSTVLSNVGIATIIAGAARLISLWSFKGAELTLKWRTDDSDNIIGFTLKNDTSISLNITAQLNWNNPTTASTYNATVGPRGSKNVDIENSPSPVNSASMAVFSTDVKGNIKQQVYDDMTQQAVLQGMRVINAKVGGKKGGGGGGSGSGSITITLTPAEKALLLEIAEALKGAGNVSYFAPNIQKLVEKCGGPGDAVKLAAKVKAGKA